MRERELFNFSEQLESSVGFFKPRTKNGQRLVMPESDFWKERPYFHERVLVSCWIYLIERNKCEPRDVQKLAFILRWIAGLKEKQLFSGSKERVSDPVLLNNQNRLRLDQQADNLENIRFYEQNDWKQRLYFLVRRDVGEVGFLFTHQISQIEKAIKKEASIHPIP